MAAFAADIKPATGVIAPTSTPIVLKGEAESGFNAVFSNSFLKASSGKSFTDSFTFTIGSQNVSTGSLTASAIKTQDLYISSFDLYSASGALVAAGINRNANSSHTGELDDWVLPESTLLSSGSYYLKVAGQVVGAAGGSYSGTLVLAPVPEPETYAMLLGGLGLIGVVARRRKANKAA